MGLITLLDFKAYLQLTDEDNDPFLQTFVDGINLAVERVCGREFLAKRMVREVYDGTNGTKLWLKRTPIIEVELVGSGHGDNLQILPTSYYSSNATSIFTDGISGFIFTQKTNWWKVTYTGGYLQGKMPADLILVVCKQASLLYKDQSERLGISSRSLSGDFVQTFERTLSPIDQQILDSYKKVVL